MFDKPKPIPLPKGAKETFAVRYRGGRKVFSTQAEAIVFHSAEIADGGWAETTRLVEQVTRART